MKAAALILAVACCAAQAAEGWREIAIANGSGAVWSVRAGRVAVTAAGIAAFVQREEGQTAMVFVATVDPKHCTARVGEVALQTIDGEPVARTVYQVGDSSTAERIAAALCAAYTAQRSAT